MEHLPTNEKRKISSQEEFQIFYEKGLSNAKDLNELQKFLDESSNLGFKPELSANLFATAIMKGIKITAQEISKIVKAEK